MQNDDDSMIHNGLPACVDFRMSPPVTVNMQMKHNDSHCVDDHVILGKNHRITIAFFVTKSDLTRKVTLAITALVARLNPSEGFSPISLAVNGRTFVTNHTMPGGGHKGETSTFIIPPELLTVERNSATIKVARD